MNVGDHVWLLTEQRFSKRGKKHVKIVKKKSFIESIDEDKITVLYYGTPHHFSKNRQPGLWRSVVEKEILEPREPDFKDPLEF